jgi:NAD+ kinase
VRRVISVAASEDRSVCARILSDPDRALSERIIREQFTV